MYQEAIAYAIVNFNRNFLLLLKTIVNSCLVLGVAISCLQIMKYFSHKHKLHFFVDVGIRSHFFHLPRFNVIINFRVFSDLCLFADFSWMFISFIFERANVFPTRDFSTFLRF